MDSDLLRKLEELEAQGLRRRLRVLNSPQGVRVQSEGRWLWNFSSNDYLGLSHEPFLMEVARGAVDRYGVGSGASRLVCGNLQPHEELEAALARWKGTEAALSFSSGYATAVGTVSALVGRGDVVILDKLCHASLIDGARLSGAELRVFAHNDVGRLEGLLQWARQKAPQGRVLVLTEGVFSMDGDRCPLRELVEVKERYGAWLLVDEAHSAGVLGEAGRGLVDEEGVQGRVEVQMGTLSKALGCSGGYVCGSGRLRDWLLNRARAFVYSTAPSPVAAVVATEAVRWMETGEAAQRRRRLGRNREVLREGMGEAGGSGTGSGGERGASAIVPVVLGEAARAVEASEVLAREGFWVPAIRYPTVARGRARLRVTVNALHEEEVVARLGQRLRGLLGMGEREG
jgi:8-amino-7-oxononanoate synthase